MTDNKKPNNSSKTNSKTANKNTSESKQSQSKADPKKTEQTTTPPASVTTASSQTSSPSTDSSKTNAPKTDKIKEEQAKYTATVKPPLKTNTKPKAEDKQTKDGKKATIAIIIAIIATVSVAGFAFYQHGENQKIINTLQTKLESSLATTSNQLANKLSTKQDEQAKELASFNNALKIQVAQQDKTIKSLQLAVSDVNGRRPNDWLLAEADYLVKMAGRKLFLEHDVNTSTQLMIAADQRIAALNDPSLTPLRKIMAEDVTKLKALPSIDRDGLTLKLLGLQKMVDQMPLSSSLIAKEDRVKEDSTISEDINDWQNNLMTSVKDLSSNFVRLEPRSGDDIPLLSPEQHFYLQENIKAKLDMAIKGVQSENNEVYQTALNTSIEWVNKYFNTNAVQVKTFTEELTTLSAENINVTYPVKLETQSELDDLISDRLRRSVTVIGEENK